MKPWKLFVFRLICSFLPETRCFSLKASLLRWCGARVGNNVRIGSSVSILGTGVLEIGDDVWIGARGLFLTGQGGRIVIGSHVDIAGGVSFTTGSHRIDTEGVHVAGVGTQGEIVLEDGAWIGMGAVLLPGVQIGNKAVVGAGAVVTRSCAPYCVYGGVPAKTIRELNKPNVEDKQ